MKIAFILSSCENSGPFIVSRDIVNNIYNDNDVTIYYLKESKIKLNFKVPCIKVDFFSKTDFSKYDIVHSHGFIADVYSYLNRNTIKKRIITLHQKIEPQYSLNYNKVIGYVLEKLWLITIKRANAIVTLSEEMSLYYKNRLKNSNVQFIHNGITPNIEPLPSSEEISKIKELRLKYKILGISANLLYRKGIDQLIKAVSADEHKMFAILLIGDGNESANLKKMALKLGVYDRCMFLGYKNNAIDYFTYFDFYVMCSRTEGFGLCVIEAASQKIPVICCNLPVFDELFTREEVEIYELENIQSLLTSIYNADRNAFSLSAKIYSKYINNYTAEIMASKYFDLYHSLLKEN